MSMGVSAEHVMAGSRFVSLRPVRIFGWPGIPARLMQTIRRMQATRDTARLLSALNDEALADIGVVRAEIPVIARRLSRRFC